MLASMYTLVYIYSNDCILSILCILYVDENSLIIYNSYITHDLLFNM